MKLFKVTKEEFIKKMYEWQETTGRPDTITLQGEAIEKDTQEECGQRIWGDIFCAHPKSKCPLHHTPPTQNKIEELNPKETFYIHQLVQKLNEIIRHLNKLALNPHKK